MPDLNNPESRMFPNRVQHLARYSYVSGIVGMLVLIAAGMAAASVGALDHGWRVGSRALVGAGNHAAFAVLALTLISMFWVEVLIRWRIEGRFLVMAPMLRARRWPRFLLGCAGIYLVELGLLALAYQFYSHANAYALAVAGPTYLPWLQLLYLIVQLYLVIGLPYVILTRALLHSEEEDGKSPWMLAVKTLHLLLRRLGLGALAPYVGGWEPGQLRFQPHDKIVFTSVLVKMFFVPLMTIFFVDQFFHFVSNWEYIFAQFRGVYAPNVQRFAQDFYQISFTFLLTLDVGLAWAGYICTSRWVRTGYVSVEPTFLGWFVALACYPPFSDLLGTYFTIPAEKGFLAIGYPWLVLLFAVVSILSYAIYVSATAAFGLRFSNLTHRGIIAHGPYALVRHPAYAAKNLAWWCVMMPSVIYQAVQQQHALILLELLGLATMSFLYYWRAVTEERHLKGDPVYRDYMARVKYRFIPGLI